MIEESALILSIDPSFDHQTQSVATLEIVRRTACGLCGQKRGCGNALWGKLFAHKASAFKAKNSINAKVGQQVIVGINEQALLKSAFFLYLVPLVTMFLASILLERLMHTDEGAIVGAIIGLILGFIWVKGFTSGKQYFVMHQPEILRLADDEVKTVEFVN